MPPVGFEPTISAGERPQAACLLRSWFRIPPGAWIFVCCECRVLSGRGLCDELITRPVESYRLCCVVVCDLETSRIGAPYIYIYDISRLRVNQDDWSSTVLLYPCVYNSLASPDFPPKTLFAFLNSTNQKTQKSTLSGPLYHPCLRNALLCLWHGKPSSLCAWWCVCIT